MCDPVAKLLLGRSWCFDSHVCIILIYVVGFKTKLILLVLFLYQ